MDTVRAHLIFQGYSVDSLQFEAKSEMAIAGNELMINPHFDRRIIQNGEDQYDIQLNLLINEETLPFSAKVSVIGHFQNKGIQDIENALQVNATAILYPYVRATMSMLTNLAQVPSVNLPTINLAKMFERSAQKEAIHQD